LGTLQLLHQLSAPPVIRLQLLNASIKPYDAALPRLLKYLCYLKSVSTWARVIICVFLLVVFKIFNFNFIMIYGHNRYEINSSVLHINIHVLPREVINDVHYRSIYTVLNARCLERKLTNLWSYLWNMGLICDDVSVVSRTV